jgi:hypothetical protein
MKRPIRGVRPVLKTFFLTLLATSSLAVAQDGPEAGGHEFQVWTGGGHSVSGGTSDTSVWNAGLRYGWILTQPHLPSILRGRFEVAVDAVPAFVVFQRANTAYGAGVNPVCLKWIFTTRGHVWDVLLGRACLVAGCPLPAHFQCGPNRTESGGEYGRGAIRIWEVFWKEVDGRYKKKSKASPVRMT